MRILMFGWEFPPYNSGGLGNACYGLSRALVQQGIKIAFVLPKKLKLNSLFLKLIFADDQYSLPLTAINSLLVPYISAYQYGAQRSLQQSHLYGESLLAEVYRYGLLARHIAQTEKFDLIHAHDWLSFRAGLEAKRVSQKPLVVHVHATEYDRSGGRTADPRKARRCDEVLRIELQGLQEADRIIAVSNYTKGILTRFYKVPADKIDVVHNGVLARPGLAEDAGEERGCETSSVSQNVNTGCLLEAGGEESPADLDKLKQRTGYKIVLFVGRITLQKGPDWFIRAADKVLQYNRQVLFIIAGAGDMQSQIIQQAADLGISDKVLFAGFLRGAELTNVYQAADLFVMPSVSEPFGLTSLESLSNGTPILISKQSGVAEILPHALKVDFWDVDEMANQILAVLNYKALRQSLQENGKKTVEDFKWKNSAERCIRVYDKTLAAFQSSV